MRSSAICMWRTSTTPPQLIITPSNIVFSNLADLIMHCIHTVSVQDGGLMLHPLCFALLLSLGSYFPLSWIPHLSLQFCLIQCASLLCLPVAFKTSIFIEEVSPKQPLIYLYYECRNLQGYLLRAVRSIGAILLFLWPLYMSTLLSPPTLLFCAHGGIPVACLSYPWMWHESVARLYRHSTRNK